MELLFVLLTTPYGKVLEIFICAFDILNGYISMPYCGHLVLHWRILKVKLNGVFSKMWHPVGSWLAPIHLFFEVCLELGCQLLQGCPELLIFPFVSPSVLGWWIGYHPVPCLSWACVRRRSFVCTHGSGYWSWAGFCEGWS